MPYSPTTAPYAIIIAMKHVSFLGKKNAAFTIVELLIVVVVIGILATITVVVYNGVTTGAQDTARRDGAKKLKDAYALFMLETGKSPRELLCGYNDAGNGFLQYTDGATGAYAGPTCIDLLVEAGYLPGSFEGAIPVNQAYANRADRTYMLYLCNALPRAALLLWHLAQPTADEAAEYTAIAQQCSSNATPYYEFGMRTGTLLKW